MQALFSAGGGTLLRMSSVKATEAHQHSPGGLPVSFCNLHGALIRFTTNGAVGWIYLNTHLLMHFAY
jgi:hypothetical protein